MKREALIIAFLFMAMLITACSTQQPVCNKPYILVGNDCCLDKDDNSVCDRDEEELTQKAERKPSIDQEELAEETALSFARAWEREDWSSLYDFFVDELKELRTEERFANAMNKKEEGSNIVVRLDKVEIADENTAYAYYTGSSSIFDIKAPAMKLEWLDKGWKVNAFSSVFNSCDEFESNCCGNGKCEASEDSDYCPVDCAVERIYLRYNKLTSVRPLDNLFLIELHGLTNETKLQGHDSANITVNGNNFMAEYEKDYPIGNKFYLRYILLRSFDIVILIFNQD